MVLTLYIYIAYQYATLAKLQTKGKKQHLAKVYLSVRMSTSFFFEWPGQLKSMRKLLSVLHKLTEI